jgi:pentose-5-phosphate-3-epimerase
MANIGKSFYHKSSLKNFSKEDIAKGTVIKINPALITILDTIDTLENTAYTQQKVLNIAKDLISKGNLHTLHIDINFDDYKHFGIHPPSVNSHIFTPEFLEKLYDLSTPHDVLLNVHLLTNHIEKHLLEINHINLGAICFQLEVIKIQNELAKIIDLILSIDACVSPVIETVGSENFTPSNKETILQFLSPFFDKIGMLTFQLATTGMRSDHITNLPFTNNSIEYINFISSHFPGTIQIQGGITTKTIGIAVNLGSEFFVCGTEIFNNAEGYSPQEVVHQLLANAHQALLK